LTGGLAAGFAGGAAGRADLVAATVFRFTGGVTFREVLADDLAADLTGFARREAGRGGVLDAFPAVFRATPFIGFFPFTFGIANPLWQTALKMNGAI